MSTASANGRAKTHGRLKKPGEILDEAPPNSKQAERGLLGSILLDGNVMTKVADVVAVDDFWDPQYRRVYDACLEIHREGKAVDALMLQDRLVASGALDGSVSWLLAEIADADFTAKNAPQYASTIAEKAQLRRMSNVGARLLQLARDERRASKDPDSLLAEADDLFATIRRKRKDATDDDKIDMMDLLSMELPETKWTVPGLICEGLTILASVPKFGKSWLALNIGMAVTSGGYALGKIKVEQGRVLALCLEDQRKRLRNRVERMSKAEGGFASRGLVAVTTWKRIGEGGIEAIEADLEANPNTRLVIVDTLQKIRRKTASKDKYQDDYEALGALKAVADKYGVAILVIHHTRKGRGEDPLEEVSGTFGITGAADSILVAKRQRGQHDAVLFLTGRDVEERELSLAWDKQYCLWSLLGDAEEFGLSDERQAVVDLLRENVPARLGPKQVSDALGKSYGSIRWMLADMAKRGQILCDAAGSYTVCT